MTGIISFFYGFFKQKITLVFLRGRLKKFFMRMLCAFIPGKERRKRFRERFYPKKHVIIEDNGENTKIILPSAPLKGCVHIRVSGRNNVIEIADTAGICGVVDIDVYGNDCRIFIGKGVYTSALLKIVCGQKHPNFGAVDNVDVCIGEGTSFESASLITYNSNTRIGIGKDCMFAYDIVLYNTDAHPVYDLKTMRLINGVKETVIGDHCWIGMGALILKNVRLAHDTIVGAKSVVAKSFEEPNIAVAGNPAKKIKSGVTWARGDEAYTKNGF